MEWQPIKTAPKDGTVILLYAHTSGRNDYRWFIGRSKADTTFYKKRADWYALPLTHSASHALLFNPTHWMPLPQPLTYRAKGEV